MQLCTVYSAPCAYLELAGEVPGREENTSSCPDMRLSYRLQLTDKVLCKLQPPAARGRRGAFFDVVCQATAWPGEVVCHIPEKEQSTDSVSSYFRDDALDALWPRLLLARQGLQTCEGAKEA